MTGRFSCIAVLQAIYMLFINDSLRIGRCSNRTSVMRCDNISIICETIYNSFILTSITPRAQNKHSLQWLMSLVVFANISVIFTHLGNLNIFLFSLFKSGFLATNVHNFLFADCEMFFGGSQGNLDEKIMCWKFWLPDLETSSLQVSPGVTSAAAVVAKVNWAILSVDGQKMSVWLHVPPFNDCLTNPRCCSMI